MKKYVLIGSGLVVLVLFAFPLKARAQINPNPPSRRLKLVFLHASVGEQWLNEWLGGRHDMEAYWNISLGGRQIDLL